MSARKIGYHDVLPLDLGFFLSQFLCFNLQAEIKKAKKHANIIAKKHAKANKKSGYSISIRQKKPKKIECKSVII
jgi:hypothetical protein